jgi:hypothetical protein
MADFAVQAWWEVLTLIEDAIEEPQNFQGARAPTVLEQDANVQPKPKHNSKETFDRPPFLGSANGAERTKGRASPEFLKRHHLDKDALPVEFAEAFLPILPALLKTRME